MATKIDPRLVNGPRLLELAFEKEGRPSLRMLRSLQKRGVVPYYKIGRLILFDPAEVRDAFSQRCRVSVTGLLQASSALRASSESHPPTPSNP